MLSPSWLAVCSHHLSSRITIAFSLLPKCINLLHVAFVYCSRLLLQHILFSLAHFYIVPPRESYCCCPHCHKAIRVHLLSPSPDYWYTSFFFLPGLGPLHEIAVSAFSRCPLGRANAFSLTPIILTPPYISKCYFSTCFLTASLSLTP